MPVLTDISPIAGRANAYLVTNPQDPGIALLKVTFTTRNTFLYTYAVEGKDKHGHIEVDYSNRAVKVYLASGGVVPYAAKAFVMSGNGRPCIKAGEEVLYISRTNPAEPNASLGNSDKLYFYTIGENLQLHTVATCVEKVAAYPMCYKFSIRSAYLPHFAKIYVATCLFNHTHFSVT